MIPRKTIRFDYGVCDLKFSPDGKMLAACFRDTNGKDLNHFKLFDTETSTELRKIEIDSGKISCLAFSPDGTMLATAGRANKGFINFEVKVWNTEDWQLRWEHDEISAVLAFSPDSNLLVTGGLGYSMIFWSAQTGQQAHKLKLENISQAIDAIDFSPDGKSLAIASEVTLKLLDLPSRLDIWSIKAHVLALTAAAFSPDGRLIATAAQEGTARLWDVATSKRVRVLKEKKPIQDRDGIETLAFSPDGKLLATGGWDKEVKLWSVPTGKLLQTLPPATHGILTIAISPDGNTLAVGGYDKTITLWDLPRADDTDSKPAKKKGQPRRTRRFKN